MQILITSPIPSHPQNHGNRARVFGLCRALQARGHHIHFVYSGLEGLTPEQEYAMRDAWEHVYILKPDSLERPMSRRRHHLIDDWYDEKITHTVVDILSKWRIDACFANYVWFSKWLTAIPAELPTFIDTHDIFAERHKKLKADGITPQWFSTTRLEEAKGLDRAGTVFAIQEVEAEDFKARTKANVETLGHLIDANFIDHLSAPEKRLRVGFIASTNMVNVRTMEMLTAALTKHGHLFDSADFYLAGGIAAHASANHPKFKRLGFLETIRDFYQDTDLVLNPNIGGSGLKIKSIEALAFGRPLLATKDAMIGIDSDSPYHQFETVDDLCLSIEALAKDRGKMAEIMKSGRDAFLKYHTAQQRILDRYFPATQAPTKVRKPA